MPKQGMPRERPMRTSFGSAARTILLPALLVASMLIISGPAYTLAAGSKEVLRYELTWNGSKAGHGDITTTHNARRVQVLVQVVSDGILKAIIELWSKIQATFAAKTFRPSRYIFRLKSNRTPSEMVDLAFDHKTGLVAVRKLKGNERENHSEAIRTAYDPVSAVYLLRNQKDFRNPMYVDIYDGKARARLFVTPAGVGRISVKGGAYPAIRLNLRLVRLTGEKGQVGVAQLWLSKDRNRIPLLLTSSHMVGTIRLELVQAEYRN